MENKTLDQILYYYNYSENDHILHNYSAFELFCKLETLFNELKKEAIFNFKSAQVENNIYFNYLRDKLFKFKSDKALDDIRFLDFIPNKIKIDPELMPSLMFTSSISGSTNQDDFTFELQCKFWSFAKDYHLKKFESYITDIWKYSNFDIIKSTKAKKLFSDDYLNLFCEHLNDEAPLFEFTFNYYIKNIFNYYADKFKSEFINNITNSKDSNIDHYVDECIKQIKSTKFYDLDNCLSEIWLKDCNLKIEEFPFSNDIIISKFVNEYGFYSEDEETSNELLIEFKKQLSKIECQNMIDFLNTHKSNPAIISDKENPKQITVNQAVILLDKLGVFADANFESKSNVSKAEIISQLIGRNFKNIKSAIEQLEIKPKEVTPRYQKDLDIVQQLLDRFK